MLLQGLTLYHYLFIGAMLFVIGILGSVLCKNIIQILICIEFILTGININFVTFATYCDGIDFDGYIFSLFYTGIGAIELAVALYIFYRMFNKKHSENIDDYGDL